MKPLTGKILKCQGCAKECYIPKNRFNTFKYCSRKCKNKFGCVINVKANCAICGKIFEHICCRINKAKYCSRRCYYDSQKKKGKKEYRCLHCEKKFIGHASHNRKYCSRGCVGKCARKNWHPNYTTVREKMLREGLINKCEKCAYSEVPKILGVHHVDGNRKNNSRENLMVLCPMCHSLIHHKHICH